jgi:exodeoxyribonuclease V alpha subunit
MQVRNNYEKEVYNGDVGFVDRVAADGKALFVRYEEPVTRLVTYDAKEVDQLLMAWAISIHKSQGSEYPAVVIPVHTQHYMMLRRNLLYTGLTRGRKLVVLVGTQRALRIAVSDATVSRRFGGLLDRMRDAEP